VLISCSYLPLNFLSDLVVPQGPAALAPRTNVTVRNVSTAHIQRRYSYDDPGAGFGIILIASRCSALALAKGKTVNVPSRV
jgi:hypothetical protein